MAKFDSYLRSGRQTTLEQIYKSLNKARGSAYASYYAGTVDAETIVEVENFAIAKAIFELYETNRRLVNQFNPDKMYHFLERWEKILKITPESKNIKRRKSIIAAKMALWTKEPTRQAVIDLIKTFIGQLFVELETTTQNEVPGFVPGGADLTAQGGALLADGDWTSQVAHIIIRTWQPRDKDGNKLMSDQEYNLLVRSYLETLENWLPAWVTLSYYEFPYIPQKTPGCVSGLDGAFLITGSGTTFETTFEEGDLLEIVSDLGNLYTFTVDTIIDDENLTIIEEIEEDFTCSEYRIFGFFLDLQNLDIAPLG